MTATMSAPRSNRYDGPCTACGQTVPADTGSLTRDNLGRWIVAHIGTCPEPVPVTPTVQPDPLPFVPAGYYAYPSTDSRNDLTFVCVDRPTKGRWVGYTFVKWVIGGRPDSRVPVGQVADVLDTIIEEGIEDCAERYGIEIGQCYACNRHLTDEVSRGMGIGPECRRKGRGVRS